MSKFSSDSDMCTDLPSFSLRLVTPYFWIEYRVMQGVGQTADSWQCLDNMGKDLR